MPTWTAAIWESNPPKFDSAALTGGVPFFAMQSPSNGAVNVAPDAPVRIVVYGQDLQTTAPGPCPVELFIDGVQVTSYASTALMNGYAGHGRYFGGRYFVEAVPPSPFAYDALVRITASAYEATPQATTAWSYTVKANPAHYAGNRLLEPESWVLRPMQRFLDLEPIRLLLLQQALRDTPGAATNRDNKAARALYQIAYDTEISSVLNPYMMPDAGALLPNVTSKRSTLELDTLLQTYRGRLDAGIDALFEQGALPRSYRNNFADYKDSMLYTYRVGAAVVAVFLARAVEVRAGLV